MRVFRLGDGMRQILYLLVGLSLFLTSAGCKRKPAYFPRKTLSIRVDESGACFEGSEPLDDEALVLRVSEYAEDLRLLGKDPDRIEVLLDLDPEITYSKALSVERLIKGAGVRVESRREEANSADSKMRPKKLSDIKEEFSRMTDPPEVSIPAVDRTLKQRLWMKADGLLYLDSTLIDEMELIRLASERCYLYLMGEDVLNYLEKDAYDVQCLTLIVESGVLYRDVHRIEQLVALTPCSLKITVIRDDLVFEEESESGS
jgi:hypothetical protein